MFSPGLYSARRDRLRARIGKGLILLPGHSESPANYASNPYPFRQDSSFLYFFGIGEPDLMGLLDADAGEDALYGPEPGWEDAVWTGTRPSLAIRAEDAGLSQWGTPPRLAERLRRAVAEGRPVHFLPPYRAETALRLEELLGIPAQSARTKASPPLVRAVVEMRSVKVPEEVAQIEAALRTTGELFAWLAQEAGPGRREQELAGGLAGMMAVRGLRPAYPVILTARGEILHNREQGGVLRRGDLLLVDAGAESPEGYASDITRVFPIGGFSPEQRDVHALVLAAQEAAIAAIRPGRPYRDVHLLAARVLAGGLKDMGLMAGDVDAAVEAGAHALFFPHGLGHMLGLDVHDMEALGEDNVGYDAAYARSAQFGLSALRLAKPLAAGNAITVEPGIYFIPALIDAWKSEGRLAEFLRYDAFDRFRGFGGIRIEDDVLVTEDGARVLSAAIPKIAGNAAGTAGG